MLPFVLYPRIPVLTRLRAPKHPAFEFTFGLEPIVQFTAVLFAAFQIDFVCATSYFLVTRRVPYGTLSSPFSARGFYYLGLCTAVSLWFRWHTHLLFVVTGLLGERSGQVGAAVNEDRLAVYVGAVV
jgi:hypothetical protein